MVICAVYGCGHRTGRDGPKVKFFRFPIVTKNCPPDKKALITSRRALWILRICREDFDDEKATKQQSRVCSNHFLSGAPTFLEDISNPDWAPSINLGHDFFDGKRKLRKRKDKNSQKCSCLCDAYTGVHKRVIHKKYIRGYSKKFKKQIISNNESSFVNRDVEIVEDNEDKMPTSSSITTFNFSQSSSGPEEFHGDAHRMIHRGTIQIIDALSTAISSASIHRTTELENISSTAIIPGDVNFKTINSGNSHSTAITPADGYYPPTTLSTVITPEEDSLSTIKTEDKISDINHLEDVLENNFLENYGEFTQKIFSNSISEPKKYNASEQIVCTTHEEAFCAAETLLQYIINQDDVNNDDINFILNLAQKIKERLSVKKEIVSKNL